MLLGQQEKGTWRLLGFLNRIRVPRVAICQVVRWPSKLFYLLFKSDFWLKLVGVVNLKENLQESRIS